MTQLTDILIPLGKGSRHQDFELRMCLRSIEKHLKGVGNIFLVGEKPEWIQNIIHIPARDNPNNWNRARNIYDKIMAGISYIDDLKVDYVNTRKHEMQVSCICLSDNFLFMNDDHYLLTDYEAAEFPYYHRGTIRGIDYGNNRPQTMQMDNTERLFLQSINDFDIHCPIIYNKEKFKKSFPEKWPEHGYGIKSMYCALNEIEGEEIEDLKFKEPLMKESIYQALEGRDWFSIGDKCLKSGAMKEVLETIYPDKSRYEN